MKRYRVLSYDFDTRANILSKEIGENWQPHIKEMWQRNKYQITQGLMAEYGSINSEGKIKNFCDMGAMPISLIAFHNNFFRQARSAFVIGAYYPALTALCSLGERVLNHLMLLFRNDFKNTEEYKAVHRKDSFDNWDLAINTLEKWGVLLPAASTSFRLLRDLRNKALHFNPDTDTNDRELALEANNLFIKIINEQFSGFGVLPWYIEGTLGATFVKKNYESYPFVEKIVLPNCGNVGFMHLLEAGSSGWVVVDNYEYDNREVTDEEFCNLFNNRNHSA